MPGTNTVLAPSRIVALAESAIEIVPASGIVAERKDVSENAMDDVPDNSPFAVNVPAAVIVSDEVPAMSN